MKLSNLLFIALFNLLGFIAQASAVSDDHDHSIESVPSSVSASNTIAHASHHEAEACIKPGVAQSWFAAILSSVLISLVSLIGILAITLSTRRINTLTPILIHLAVGALLGDAFLHLLPAALSSSEETGSDSSSHDHTSQLKPAMAVVAGYLFFMLAENWIHQFLEGKSNGNKSARHSHGGHSHGHRHSQGHSHSSQHSRASGVVSRRNESQIQNSDSNNDQDSDDLSSNSSSSDNDEHEDANRSFLSKDAAHKDKDLIHDLEAASITPSPSSNLSIITPDDGEDSSASSATAPASSSAPSALEQNTTIQPLGYLNLFGDVLHNFMDGLAIGSAYAMDMRIGYATTVASLLHEIPQELGDFGVLISSGFSHSRALVLNLLVSLTCLLGTFVGLSFGGADSSFDKLNLGFTAGSFIYMAASDLVPQLMKQRRRGSTGWAHTAALGLGFFAMWLLAVTENHVECAPIQPFSQ